MDLGFAPSFNFDRWINSAGVPKPEKFFETSDWNISNPNLIANELEAKQFAYNKHIEEREDSAVQRWVKDVQKAGLNPLAFTGSGSPITAIATPSKVGFDSMLSYLNFDLSKTNKNTRNILSAIKLGTDLVGNVLSALG